MLTLKAFQPASDKVRQAEFHPVLPWIVSATKSDHVCVWDWRTKQTVWEAQLGGSDEELSADAELARLHTRDAAFTPNPSLMHPIPGGAGGAKREATGHVRDVRFLDTDVAQVQLTWQHSTASGCSSRPPRAEDVKALRGQRLLVIACDAKVLVVDLASRRVLELGKGVFEGRSPACLAFLFMAGHHHPSSGGAGGAGGGGGGGSKGWLLESPVLAVGCADGIVRCVQLFPVKPVIRLVSAHKTAVVAIAVMGIRGQRFEALAVGHQGGSVALYEPMGRAPGFLADGLAPRADVKVHDKELLAGSLAVVPMAEDPEDTRCLLVTAGSDHRVCCLDPTTLKESTKVKVDRVTLTCMAHFPRGLVACGVHPLLLGTEGGHLLVVHPPTGSVRQAAALEAMIPAGHKRAPKVYGLHVHPTMPHLVAAATNAGTAILAAAPSPLPAVPLPLTSPAQAHFDAVAAAMGAAFGGASGAGATYVTAIGPTLLCVTAATLPNQDTADFPPNQVMGKLQVASDTPGGRALLSVSHDGSYVAAVWPAARQYAIYRQGASAWQECAKGSGTSVAWHGSRDQFAVLEEEPPSTGAAAALAAARPSKDPRKAEKQAEALRAAQEAAAKAAAATAGVRVKSLAGGGGVSARPMGGPGGALELRGDAPAGLRGGGPLLAVTVRRAAQSAPAELAAGPEAADSAPPALLLYDWDTGRRVGPELPEPRLLSWDPSRTMLAIAYPSQIIVVRARPDFQVISSLPVPEADGLEWAARQLYITTPTHILVALLAPAAPPLPPSATAAAAASLPAASASSPASPAAPPPARLITLAAPGVPALGGPPGSAAAAVAAEGFLPPPATRPPGPLALLGPRDGSLWLVGVLGQPLALGLGHPGLRCCGLVASGDLQGAAELARRALAPELHDPLAALMVEMEGPRGAAAAVGGLPGLSLAAELPLRVALRQWQAAVEAAEALLAGYTRAAPPPGRGGFRAGVAAAAFGGGGGASGGGAAGRLGDDFVDLSQAAGGAPATAPAHPGDFDWTQPLRSAASSAKAAATAAIASHPAPSSAPSSPSPSAPSAAAVQLVLGLLADLLGAGLADVARHLARPLLAHAVQLGGRQLLALAAIMAQAGMKTELPALAHSVAAGADSCDREAAGLLAALLSGHTALAADSLREGGAVALAALQARVYGLSSAADSMAGWRAALAAGSPPGAVAALGRLDVGHPVAAS